MSDDPTTATPTAVTTPSGTQWQLRHGGQQATVVEIGGGVREYAVAGRPVLDGYPAHEMCSGARGTTLAPWPNRLRDGHFRFGESDHQTPLSEPKTHNAIHGLVRWRPWRLVEQRDDEVTVEVVLLPQPGYPYSLRLRNHIRLDGTGLTVTTTATNIGREPLPYGLGFHPYLTVGSDTVDGDLLRVPGRQWLPVDERGLPTAVQPVAGSAYDFREPRPIGGQAVDTAYTDLVRGDDGRARVQLASPDLARQVSLWADESFPYLQVFTGDSLAPDRRRRGLGVEPMTCAPDAFNSGAGLVTLRPGGALETSWGLETLGF